MKVSVIIPAFNEEKLLPASLRAIQTALGSLAKLGWETEVIVCDNNSTDRTAELARAAGTKVVFEPINQIGRARNTGAAAATGDWLVFVDADSEPTPELFAEMSEVIQTGRFLAGGSVIWMEGARPIPRFVTGLWNFTSRLCKWCAGSFIFCDATAFRQVGGFNTELFASEEIDLSKRLKKLGRAQNRRVAILDSHPLKTSARKLHLYTTVEFLLFFRKAIFSPIKTVRSRDACVPWYDGRR